MRRNRTVELSEIYTAVFRICERMIQLSEGNDFRLGKATVEVKNTSIQDVVQVTIRFHLVNPVHPNQVICERENVAVIHLRYFMDNVWIPLDKDSMSIRSGTGTALFSYDKKGKSVEDGIIMLRGFSS